ncbi:hypothetical protein GWK47_025517 [Chionoecetes opilio]|uniref:Uncharacterized protein n=3 Tax=Chionoecetes opilio TaxID=41210 RepID=A0A8J8WG26_CHIOP|nr:hypothetical protein GWK47_025517 [Chionoecetes opilio]
MAAATAARSRSATEVWLLGQPEPNPCWGKQLPKNGQVLRRFFHFVRVQRKSVKEAASLVTAEVAVVWEKARIPTQKKSRCVERILRLYASWQNLDRSKKRSAEVDVENRRSFSLALMTLFDIGHADAFDLITVDEDRQFLLGQRCPDGPRCIMQGVDQSLADRERRRLERGVLKRSSSPERATTATRSSSGLGAGDEEENGGDDGRDADFVPSAGISAQSACSPKRRRTPIMTPPVAAALDRTRISDRTAVHLFTAVHGADATPARSTVRRHRRSAREKMAKEIKAEMTVNVPAVPLIIHWDGKLVEGMAGEGIAERLPILVSGDGIQKLLMVPKLAAGTGVLTGQAVYDAAKEWDLVDNIIGMCFDTTVSNTGLKEGACVHIMKHVKRNLLHFACRHHVLELVVGAAFTVCFGPSSGPEIQLFKRFVKWWPLANQASSKPLDDPVDGADKIIATCHALLKEKQPRDDYREMVQLTIIVLGGEVEANIRKPGAYHRARWMAKVIYTLKITLFREEFALTKHEKRELIRFTTFIVTTYVEPWMSAHCSTSAPATDLALLKALAAYRDKEIGRASGKVMARHMWYVSEELVGLSLFDEATVVEEKRAIVSAMQQRLGEKNPPRRADVALDAVEQRSLASFATTNSVGLVTALGAGHDFLNVDPAEWSGRDDYTTARRRARHLRVVNDFAERGVALISAFCGAITRDEEQRQHLLQVVERHRALYPCAK